MSRPRPLIIHAVAISHALKLHLGNYNFSVAAAVRAPIYDSEHRRMTWIPIEALKHIRTLLQIAADSWDIEAIEKHLAMAQKVVRKALPPARSRKRPLGT